MPLYGVAQSGWNPPPNQGLNLASLEVGEHITLFNGTETPSVGLKSVAFALGIQGANRGSKTFWCSGMTAGSVIDIQAANQDVDSEYSSVSGALTPDANGNVSYPDDGQSAFYRAVLTTSTGAMPIVIVQR